MTPTVLTTLFRRDPRVVANTLAALRRALPESPVVCWVDDKQDGLEPYQQLLAGENIHVGCGSALDHLENVYHIDGYKNPAWAWNQCFALAQRVAKSSHVLILSSDVLLQPLTPKAWETFDTDAAIWTPRVIDLDTAQAWCHSSRFWPLPWALLCRADWITAIGGWDQGYMRGMAFEDNDFVGRLFKHAKRLMIDDRITAWHQSHEQTAYSDDMKGFKINEAYTFAKWESDCAPFNHEDRPIAATRFFHDGMVGVWSCE